MTGYQSDKGMDPMIVLCRMVCETKFTDLPEHIIETAKKLLLDTFGVILGGSGHKEVGIVLEFALGQEGKPESHIPVLSDRKVPAAMAAFVTAVMSRALDMGSVHEDAIHTTEHILPALLAASGLKDKVSGEEFLTAFITGTEILVRIGKASRLVKSGMTHMTDGGHYIFGAVAAVGRILELTDVELENAEGMASTMTQPHSNAMYYPPTGMAKVHHGFIAQDALNCCLLAQRGITGPTSNILSGPMGYFSLLTHWDTEIDMVTRNLGREWMMAESSIKPFAACKRTHAAVTVLLEQMKEHSFGFRDIASIDVDLPEGDFAVVAGPRENIRDPKTVGECQFSLPFVLATAAVDGRVDPVASGPDASSRMQVRSLMEKVNASRDAGLPPWSAKVRTVLQGGMAYEDNCFRAKGHPDNPLTDAELISKFRICAENAVTKPGPETIDKLVENILNLEKSSDIVRDILLLTIP